MGGLKAEAAATRLPSATIATQRLKNNNQQPTGKVERFMNVGDVGHAVHAVRALHVHLDHSGAGQSTHSVAGRERDRRQAGLAAGGWRSCVLLRSCRLPGDSRWVARKEVQSSRGLTRWTSGVMEE